MKRLQFRHNNNVFQNRESALQYFSNIVNKDNIASIDFNSSLYAEPLVSKYIDEDGNTQVIFAIGVDSGLTPYHIIDSKEIYELISKNKEDIIKEYNRAVDSEKNLEDSIKSEAERAKYAEDELDKAIDTEVIERVNAISNLQNQINNNISTINIVEPSSANVLEEYALKNANGDILGENIKIYKDSALVGALTGFKGAKNVERNEDNSFTLIYSEAERDESIEFLYLIYRDENGVLKLVGIDFENFLMEAEFKNGLSVLNHVVSVKIKDGDKYLDVDENGIFSKNIDDTIKDYVYELNTEIVNSIDAERTRAMSVESELTNSIKLEVDRSVAKDNELETLINSETERAIHKENALEESINAEIERSILKENVLETSINAEIERSKNAEEDLQNQIIKNTLTSKDVLIEPSVNGTSIIIQTDEVTITKYADAQTIYDNNVGVLGCLLKVKKVETTSNNIKSRYELQDKNGKLIGDPIELTVESALISVKQGNVGDEINPETGAYIVNGSGDTTMNFVYRLDDGSHELMQIVVSDYFKDSYFGRGLNNQNGVISLLEGDGNEYLVIGEDTISVVGVNEAINNAKTESKNYADIIYNESTAYTNTRANDIIKSVDSLTNTTSSAIESLSNSLSSAIEGVRNDMVSSDYNLQANINNLSSSILEEKTNRESADANILNKLDSDIISKNQSIAELKEKIEQLDVKDIELNNNINTLSGNIITYVDTTANTTLTESKAYADTVGLNITNKINSSKVNDVIYDNGNKIIKLIFADGTVSTGFDASEFVIDGMLDNVLFDEHNDEIKFIWNTNAGKSEIIVPLGKFVDQYKVSNDSLSYLQISDDNQISVIVDKGNNFSTTLSTTKYVDEHISTVTEDTVTKLSTLEGSIKEYIESKEISLKRDIDDNTDKITTLNGGVATIGSVSNTIKNKFSNSLITDGLPITSISIEDAKHHSLLRTISVGDELVYFASNDTSDMVYTKKDGEKVKLNEYVNHLETRIVELENKLNGIEGTIEDAVKNIVKTYLRGVSNEISITEDNNELFIGFAEDAIFGDNK